MSVDVLNQDPVNTKSTYESQLNNWIDLEKSAIELINVIGKLWFDKSVELVIFRNPMVDKSVSEILNLHNYAVKIVKKPITVNETLELARGLLQIDLAPSKIDIGKLAWEWHEEHQQYDGVSSFINDKLRNFIGSDKLQLQPRDVVLYGFGRIGRLAARELISQAGKGQQLRLRAIVTRSNSDEDIIKRAELLRTDSVHGPFPGTVIEDLENKAIVVNGQTILMIAANKPSDIDFESFGIKDALIIDNTGVWRDRDGLNQHLAAKGASKVLLTAPGKGDIPNIVYGVNQKDLDIENEKIFSAASCTTNAIVPVLKVLEDKLGVDSGHIETIHAYTNDQNLLDNYHKKYRRGRSAPLNMVITETGAGKAVTKAIPSLKGKLTANAVRVPTPNVSLAILNITLKTPVKDKEEMNNIMLDAALKGELVEQIKYSFSNELVSSDNVGNSCASIYDSPATIVTENGKHVVLYVWYDNEYGYTRQVMRLAKYLSKVRRLTYY